MKSTSWKKDFVVVMHSDYDNTWSVKTIPLTLKQAVQFVYAKRWNLALDKGTVRIVTLAESATLPTGATA
jgi:hypothetical protein